MYYILTLICFFYSIYATTSRWTSMTSSSRESSVTRNMPTASITNSRPFHDKTFEKQDRSAGVGTEMYKAITATRVSFFSFLFCLPSPFLLFSFKIFTMSLEFLIHYFFNYLVSYQTYSSHVQATTKIEF